MRKLVVNAIGVVLGGDFCECFRFVAVSLEICLGDAAEDIGNVITAEGKVMV